MKSKYRPKSWSQQAREMADKRIQYVNSGIESINHAIYFFNTSYRHSRIRIRAAKRFGRAVRAGKVHEYSFTVTKWENRDRKYDATSTPIRPF